MTRAGTAAAGRGGGPRGLFVPPDGR
jgi:hypothetical protein